MARIFKTSTWADGDVLTPHELNAELGAILGEFNGNLDRDNFRKGTITHDKFANDTFNEIVKIKGTGAPTLQVLTRTNQRPRLYDISANANAMGHISSEAMETTIHTSDGALQIEASIGFWHSGIREGGKYYAPAASSGDGQTASIHVGQVIICLEVDGVVVARSGTNTVLVQQCRYVSAYVPVGAGVHKVAVKAYVFTGRDSTFPHTPTATLATLTAAYGSIVTWKDRTLWVRHIKR